jgi:hypothetical protein
MPASSHYPADCVAANAGSHFILPDILSLSSAELYEHDSNQLELWR